MRHGAGRAAAGGAAPTAAALLQDETAAKTKSSRKNGFSAEGGRPFQLALTWRGLIHLDVE